jgi:hypothetical protein
MKSTKKETLRRISGETFHHLPLVANIIRNIQSQEEEKERQDIYDDDSP